MQHRFRGIAQLVEQRSPKPRAVSSRLTTPATNAQVLRSLCVLFLYACGRAEPFRMASAFALAMFSGNIVLIFANQENLRIFLNCFFTEGVVEENGICSAAFCESAALRNRLFRLLSAC